MVKRSERPENYVNNKQFYALLVEYKKKCEDYAARGLQQPTISRGIGDCICQIAERLSLKHNFINYPFRDDMIADGIENGMEAVLKFDGDKYDNPFAYFTQIIFYAFLRKIEKEKKLLLTKKMYYDHLYTNKSMVDNSLAGDTAAGYVDVYMTNEYMDDLHDSHLKKKEAEAEEKKKK